MIAICHWLPAQSRTELVQFGSKELLADVCGDTNKRSSIDKNSCKLHPGIMLAMQDDYFDAYLSMSAHTELSTVEMHWVQNLNDVSRLQCEGRW